MDAMSGLTSYSTLARKFKRAMNDAQVKAILFNSDTPGGAVSGAFDFSDLVYQARGVKPVYTLAADCLCSAGILIGSSAEKVYATQTAQIGSVGVVMKHMDISKWNKEKGINYTYIYAGDHKIDGNRDNPLDKEVKARFQAEIQKIYDMFVASVERNTGLSAQDIIDTQADVYLGKDAVDIGMAEAVTTGDQLLEEMKIKFGAGNRPHHSITMTSEEKTMSDDKEKPDTKAEKQGGEGAAADKAATQAAAAGDQQELQAQIGEAVDADSVRAEERTRFATIMNSDEAKGRTKSAVHLATKSDMSADDVIATLADMPVEAKGTSKLDTAMAATGTPGVGAEAETAEMTDSDTILGDYNSARGKSTGKAA
jgi:signal peptide peptidase SppA